MNSAFRFATTLAVWIVVSRAALSDRHDLQSDHDYSIAEIIDLLDQCYSSVNSFHVAYTVDYGKIDDNYEGESLHREVTLTAPNAATHQTAHATRLYAWNDAPDLLECYVWSKHFVVRRPNSALVWSGEIGPADELPGTFNEEWALWAFGVWPLIRPSPKLFGEVPIMICELQGEIERLSLEPAKVQIGEDLCYVIRHGSADRLYVHMTNSGMPKLCAREFVKNSVVKRRFEYCDHQYYEHGLSLPRTVRDIRPDGSIVVFQIDEIDVNGNPRSYKTKPGTLMLSKNGAPNKEIDLHFAQHLERVVEICVGIHQQAMVTSETERPIRKPWTFGLFGIVCAIAVGFRYRTLHEIAPRRKEVVVSFSRGGLNKNYGMTLVEVLIVIAIVGLLVGLTLPAVQMARESARRVQCQNNLKQLSLAAISFESTYRAFPSGGWGKDWAAIGGLGTGPAQPGGWIYQVLPEMEEDALFSMGGVGDNEGNTMRLTTPLGQLICPSRRSANNFSNPRPWIPHSHDATGAVARNDYAMNGGTNVVLYGSGPSSLEDASTFRWPNNLATNGICHQRSQVRVSAITDGLSNTYLLGEKALPVRHYQNGENWGDNEGAFSGDDRDLIRYGGFFERKRIDPVSDHVSAPAKPMQGLAFGGPHAGLFQMAFADGSVSTLAIQIDADVHIASANRNTSGRN